jgi:hypothetical protein
MIAEFRKENTADLLIYVALRELEDFYGERQVSK